MEKLVHLAIKVESQLFKKTSFKHIYNDGFYDSSWKGKNKFSKQDNPSKEFTPKTYKNPSPSRTKSLVKTSSTKSFKCLGFGHIAVNCPNKRTMMVRGASSK